MVDFPGIGQTATEEDTIRYERYSIPYCGGRKSGNVPARNLPPDQYGSKNVRISFSAISQSSLN
jgi:hypothetical protein